MASIKSLLMLFPNAENKIKSITWHQSLWLYTFQRFINRRNMNFFHNYKKTKFPPSDIHEIFLVISWWFEDIVENDNKPFQSVARERCTQARKQRYNWGQHIKCCGGIQEIEIPFSFENMKFQSRSKKNKLKNKSFCVN